MRSSNKILILMNHQRFFWVFILLAAAAYTLPWIVNRGASLNLGAYDLAEWASLHPSVRGSNPTLLDTFLLRFPLACLALITAFASYKRVHKWPHILFVVVIAAALLPPVEFFADGSGDWNYRQQFALALLALMGGVIGLSGITRQLSPWLEGLFALAAMLTGWIGLLQVYRLMQEFDLPVQIGWGCFLLGGLCLLLIRVNLLIHIKTNRAAFNATLLN
jgi:hypothetical protein